MSQETILKIIEKSKTPIGVKKIHSLCNGLSYSRTVLILAVLRKHREVNYRETKEGFVYFKKK